MFVLISYDVNITSPAGAKRLRKVSKLCQDHGKRVQNSVFECVLTEAQFVLLKDEINRIIDSTNDSVRFYNLGSHWESKVITMGKDNGLDFNGDLII